jgi:hypothetical protein
MRSPAVCARAIGDSAAHEANTRDARILLIINPFS